MPGRLGRFPIRAERLVVALGNPRLNRRFRVGPVMVDAVGIGHHVATHLADHGFDGYGFNAAGAVMDSDHFVSAKTKAYWALRESLAPRRWCWPNAAGNRSGWPAGCPRIEDSR